MLYHEQNTTSFRSEGGSIVGQKHSVGSALFSFFAAMWDRQAGESSWNSSNTKRRQKEKEFFSLFILIFLLRVVCSSSPALA